MKRCCKAAVADAAQEAIEKERETLKAWLRNRARELDELNEERAAEERRESSWDEGYEGGREDGEDYAREDLSGELARALGLRRRFGCPLPPWKGLLEKVRELVAKAGTDG